MSNSRVVSLFIFATIVVMVSVLFAGSRWNNWRSGTTVDAYAPSPTKIDTPIARESKPHHAEEPRDKRDQPKPKPESPRESATSAPISIEDIRARLDALGPEATGPERVAMEAAMGYALLERPLPDLPAAGKAFETALDHAPSPDARVPMARDFGLALLYREGEEQVIGVTASGRLIGAQLTPERLQIEAIRGIAYDALGLGIRAQDTFREAFETLLETSLNETELGQDVARILGLRLARKYRDAGDLQMAKAVSTRMRSWLGEDDLVLR